MLKSKKFGKSLGDTLWYSLGHPACPLVYSLQPSWMERLRSVFGQSLKQSLSGFLRYGISDSIRDMYD